MKCPKCSNDLVHEIYEGIEIDRCSECNGTWLDEDELPKILESREEKFDEKLIEETFTLAFAGVPQDENRSIERCPKCNKAMKAINYNYSSGIIIDRCPDDHGVWLDANELDSIQAYFEKNQDDFEKNKEAWMELAESSKSSQFDLRSENDQRNNRPISYVVNSLIKKVLGV